MIERTALKLYPIAKEVHKRMIEEKVVGEAAVASLYEQMVCEEPDMRTVLGFLNQNEWVFGLNIGNIM